MIPPDLRAALQPLVTLLAPLVAEAMRAAACSSIAYTTAPGGRLPPGRSRRWLREHAREMGGVRSGGKRGRGVVWSVTAEQYDAWCSRARVAPELPSPAPVVDLDAWIRDAGYRATRVAGGSR